MHGLLGRFRVAGTPPTGANWIDQMTTLLAQFRPSFSVSFLAGAATVAVAPIPVHAQQPGYPSKPITLVVPFPAGGPTDAGARLFARSMSETLGRPIVIDNHAGAGGTVGSAAVTRAATDGYTLLWGETSTLAMAPGLYKSLGYDARSFVPIGMALRGRMMLAGPSVTARDLGQLIALGQRKKLTVATAGNRSLGHLAAEHLRELTGMRLVHVPYRGGSPAINDALGAQVDLVLDTDVRKLVAEPLPTTSTQMKRQWVQDMAIWAAPIRSKGITFDENRFASRRRRVQQFCFSPASLRGAHQEPIPDDDADA